jgi:hypothetical protein
MRRLGPLLSRRPAPEGGRGDQGVHGSRSSTGRPRKSRPFLVTRVRPWAIAVAARRPSIEARPCPRRLASAIRSPQRKAVCRSTGRIRPAKRSTRSPASQWASASWRRPVCISAMPRRISASVTTLMKARSSSSRSYGMLSYECQALARAFSTSWDRVHDLGCVHCGGLRRQAIGPFRPITRL